MSKRIDIVVCPDKWFVMPTGVMMRSVCVNNPDVNIVFHVIIDDSVTEGDKKDLRDVISAFKEKKVEFYHIDVSTFPCFPNLENKGLPPATYYRLQTSQILPSYLNKVLYLDGDVIVRHSLLPLWETDLTGYAVAAVPDCTEATVEYYDRLKYPQELGYFNAGVMLINLDYWRINGVEDEFMSFLTNRADDIYCYDQDVLNAVFKDRKIILPIKYNLHHGFMWTSPKYDYQKYKWELYEALNAPTIIHFTGEKPWYAYRRDPQNPLSSSFFKYQNQTKWKGVMIDKRPLKRRVINLSADLLRRLGLKKPLDLPFTYQNIKPVD